MILDNLETPGISSQGQNWAFFTDGVMGGLSQGKAIISKVNEIQSNRPDQGSVLIVPTSSIRIWPQTKLLKNPKIRNKK